MLSYPSSAKEIRCINKTDDKQHHASKEICFVFKVFKPFSTAQFEIRI